MIRPSYRPGNVPSLVPLNFTVPGISSQFFFFYPTLSTRVLLTAGIRQNLFEIYYFEKLHSPRTCGAFARARAARESNFEGRRDESTVDNSVSKPQNPAHWGPGEGAATGMSSLGVPLLTAKTWGRWSMSGQTYETTYAHPAPATLGARRLFG
jgi:hypothetical protein